MNLTKKVVLITIIILFFPVINISNTNAGDTEIVDSQHQLNISVDNVKGGSSKNNLLNRFKDSDEHFNISTEGGKGLFYVMVEIAKSLKNLFFILATIFYIIIALKLIVADKTEDEVTKFKKGIIWITIGLMIMQIAYIFVLTLFAQSIGEVVAFDLIDNIINPLIGLMEMLASFFFLAIAIFAFYRLITAHGKEEEIKRAKMSIIYAIMGFILIILAKTIVEGVYGKLDCQSDTIAGYDIITTNCIGTAQLSNLSSSIITIINWANSFIGIITVVLIIYAGFNVLFSRGDEEKLKKSKSILLYIAIGLFLLVTNYLILTFFLLPENII